MAVTPNLLNIDGDDDSGILLTSDSAVVWSTDAGTLYTDAGLTSEYDGVTVRTTIYFKPFNRTVEGEIVAGASTAYVTITGVLPDSPHYPMEWEGDKPGTVISISRSGRRRGRVLGDSDYLRNYKLVYNNKNQLTTEDFEDFFAYHYPHRSFKYRNLWHGIDGIFYFDSKFKGSAQGRNRANNEIAIAETPTAFDFSANLILDDVASYAWGAYSTKKLYRRYRGAAVRIKDSTNFEKDIGFDSNGSLDTTQLTGNAPYKIVYWYDQSGNGRHLSGDAVATPTLNVTDKAINFNDQFFAIPSLSGVTAMEAIVKKRLDVDFSASGEGGLWTIGTSGLAAAVPWGDGDVYDSFGSTTRKNTSGLAVPTATSTDWHVYSARTATNDWAAYLNGTQIIVTASNTVAWTGSPKLGRTTSSFYHKGDMETFILVPPKLTDAERVRLHANL